MLPPHKGAAPPPSNLRRLADIIITYTPDDPAAAAPQAPQPQPQPNQAGGINISRPDGQGAGASSAPPPPHSPNTSGGANTSPGKRKWLIHDELLAALPADVYQALDMAAGMLYISRVKLQESCRKGDMANLLDRTISAAFSHQTLLALSDGAHFDPLKRGLAALALAGAGRSATVPGAPGQTLSDTVTRDAHLSTVTLRECWQEALPAFAADGELSGSHVENLWRGAHFILTVWAARSTTWGVPEVETACNEQFSSLPAYRSAVASVINRVARA